jgi:serine/threonine protein kinase
VTSEFTGDGPGGDSGLPPGLDERFEVLELLGRGGMGVVYLARDRRLGREVALKLLTSPGEKAMALLEAEARSLAQLEHDHVVRLYELGFQKGVPFLVMELMRGWPLSTRLAEGRPTLVEAVRIAVDMLLGLARAHELGLVHRDVKPGNVFLEQTGRVKVADFGLAVSITGQSSAAGNGLVGTPAYMAPEQFKALPADARTDVFSLGVIAYEMLSGDLPFGRGTLADVVLSQARGVPPMRPDLIPPAAERAIKLALDEDPDRRPGSPQAFATQLSAALEG